nr:efflux RND transporter periplasmic adaptor subunit [uncultured Sphingosinicella sp.]
MASCSDGSGQAQAQGPPQGPPPVVVAQPVQRQIIDWDEYIGRFEPMQRVDVRPRVSGYLQSINFRDGQTVRQGQLLFQIDPRPFQALLAQSQADEARARTALNLARSEAARSRTLLNAQAVSREEYEARAATVASAQAALGAAQAAVRARALDVEFAQVRAPISGRVSDTRIDRGNLVAGGSTGEATVLTTIMSVNPIHFQFEGSESVYLKYQRQNRAGSRTSSRFAANPVEIRLQDDPGYSIRGRMDFVDNALDARSGTIRGRAVVANPDGFLTPGMFGRMRLLGSGAYTGLLLPEAAISTDQTRKVAMTVGRDGTVTPKVIELGPMVDGLRVVRSGLSPNDRVIISGLQRVRPGDKATARLGRITAPAPGEGPQVGTAYSAPPAASASSSQSGR